MIKIGQKAMYVKYYTLPKRSIDREAINEVLDVLGSDLKINVHEVRKNIKVNVIVPAKNRAGYIMYCDLFSYIEDLVRKEKK